MIVQQSEAELWLETSVEVRTVTAAGARAGETVVEAPSWLGCGDKDFCRETRPAEMIAEAAIIKITRETAATVLDFIWSKIYSKTCGQILS